MILRFKNGAVLVSRREPIGQQKVDETLAKGYTIFIFLDIVIDELRRWK